jgi:hypothetical protein
MDFEDHHRYTEVLSDATHFEVIDYVNKRKDNMCISTNNLYPVNMLQYCVTKTSKWQMMDQFHSVNMNTRRNYVARNKTVLIEFTNSEI